MSLVILSWKETNGAYKSVELNSLDAARYLIPSLRDLGYTHYKIEVGK